MFTDYSRLEVLVSDLSKLLESGDGADVLFRLGIPEQRLQAHSMIIAARCRVLEPIIREHFGQLRQKNGGALPIAPPTNDALQFDLPHLQCTTFRDVLVYIYTGRITINNVNVFEVFRISSDLGIPRLQEISIEHIENSQRVENAIDFLQQALELEFEPLAVRIVQFIAAHCAHILQTSAFARAPAAVLRYIIKQENLNASEVEIWNGVINWAATAVGIETPTSVSAMSGMDRQRIIDYVSPFLRPGYIRILNIDVETFANEVEPLGLLSQDELLLKYRFDASCNIADFELAFPIAYIEFLSRTRQRTQIFESSHPHECGVNLKVRVDLPAWSTQVKLVFDQRCSLGQYTDLIFYQDEACTTMLSILTDTRRERWNGHLPRLSLADGLTFHLSRNHFWFTFCSTRAFPPKWGYRFEVHTM